MKKISRILCFVLLPALIAAQTSFKDKSVQFGGTLYYTSFSPDEHIKSAYEPVEGGFDEGSYGGISANIWMVFKSGKSPFKFGFDIGGNLLRLETLSTNLVWSDTGDPVEVVDNLVAFHFLAITDIYFNSTTNPFFHVQAGIGGLLLDEGMSKPPFSPAFDLAASVRLLFSIPLSATVTLDPQVGVLQSFSKNNIFTFNAGVGISAHYF